jgi:hypothetical protein
VLLLVPLGGSRDQLAILVAAGDVGDDDGRQFATHMETLALAAEAAFAAQIAQERIQLTLADRIESEWRTMSRLFTSPPRS